MTNLNDYVEAYNNKIPNYVHPDDWYEFEIVQSTCGKGAKLVLHTDDHIASHVYELTFNVSDNPQSTVEVWLHEDAPSPRELWAQMADTMYCRCRTASSIEFPDLTTTS